MFFGGLEMSDIVKRPIQRNLNISEAVIEAITRETAMEIDGITKLSPLPVDIKNYILKARKPRTIKIELRQGTVCIAIGIYAEYGKSIPKIAKKLQENVKAAVQEMTGLVASRVDVHVMGLEEIPNCISA